MEKIIKFILKIMKPIFKMSAAKFTQLSKIIGFGSMKRSWITIYLMGIFTGVFLHSKKKMKTKHIAKSLEEETFDNKEENKTNSTK